MLRALGRWRQVRDREGAVGPSRTGITREARVLPREMRSEKSPFARDAQSPSRTGVIREARALPTMRA